MRSYASSIINIDLGLISHDLMHQFQDLRQVIAHTPPFDILLYLLSVTHTGLSLWTVATRRTLRMPSATIVQVALGILIPLVLLPHILLHALHAPSL